MALAVMDRWTVSASSANDQRARKEWIIINSLIGIYFGIHPKISFLLEERAMNAGIAGIAGWVIFLLPFSPFSIETDQKAVK